jgi:hypothetical protein
MPALPNFENRRTDYVTRRMDRVVEKKQEPRDDSSRGSCRTIGRGPMGWKVFCDYSAKKSVEPLRFTNSSGFLPALRTASSSCVTFFTG